MSSNSPALDAQVEEGHSSRARKNMFIEMGLGSGMGCQSDQQNLRDGIKMLRCQVIKHVAQTTATKRPEAVRHRETYSAPNRKSMFIKWKLGRPYRSAPPPSRDLDHKPFSMEVGILCSPEFPPKHQIFGYVILFCFLNIQA